MRYEIVFLIGSSLIACGGKLAPDTSSDGSSSGGSGGGSKSGTDAPPDPNANPGAPEPQVDLVAREVTNPITADVAFYSVWAANPSDAWIVGQQGVGNLILPLFLHWNGSVWSEVHGPSLPGVAYTVQGTGSSDVWFGLLGAVAHWDGTSITTVHRHDSLYGYFGVSLPTPSSVWSVGADVLSHFDGTSWSDRPFPFAPHEEIGAIGTFGGRTWLATDANKIYVTSSSGDFVVDDKLTFVVDLGDSVLTMFVPGPDDLFFYSGEDRGIHHRATDRTWSHDDLGMCNVSFWGANVHDVWAVGSDCKSNTAMAARFDGSKWNAFPIPNAEGMMSVSGSAVDDVWAISWNRIFHITR
jgi:hypothetical protein